VGKAKLLFGNAAGSKEWTPNYQMDALDTSCEVD